MDIDLGYDLKDDEHRLPRTPEEFIQVFRRVHRIWDEPGVRNVAYVWHSISDRVSDLTLLYWPGDKDVDWIGLSMYEEKQVPNGMKLAEFGRVHRNIMESGPFNGSAKRWEDWHGPFLRACGAMGVKAICYNNWKKPPVGDVFKNSAFERLPRSIAEGWAGR